MATTTGLLSWEEFEKFPHDGMHHELIEGEHQVLPPPKAKDTIVAERVAELLRVFKARGLGKVFSEAGYKISNDPASWIQPDLSFLSAQRLSTMSGGYFIGAPELAVEIVSPSETARSLQRKIRLLLDAGSLAVVVIYPEEREVVVHRRGQAIEGFRPGDALTLPGLLPDWQLPVAKIFED